MWTKRKDPVENRQNVKKAYYYETWENAENLENNNAEKVENCGYLENVRRLRMRKK